MSLSWYPNNSTVVSFFSVKTRTPAEDRVTTMRVVSVTHLPWISSVAVNFLYKEAGYWGPVLKGCSKYEEINLPREIGLGTELWFILAGTLGKSVNFSESQLINPWAGYLIVGWIKWESRCPWTSRKQNTGTGHLPCVWVYEGEEAQDWTGNYLR